MDPEETVGCLLGVGYETEEEVLYEEVTEDA